MNDMEEKRIWKYDLEVADTQVIEVPYGGSVISVIAQNNTPVLYCLVDPYTELRDRITLFMVGTGHPLGEEMLRVSRFIGSVSTFGGQLIWHIFLKIEPLIERES